MPGRRSKNDAPRKPQASLGARRLTGRADYKRALELAQDDLTGNLPEALGLLKRAVTRGYAPAQYALATWYLFGVGVGRDASKAVGLFRKASSKVADAAYDLAVSYEKGVGVKKDVRAAFRYYSRAAKLGDHQSEYELARCYRWGIGTLKNPVKTELWFQRALKHRVEDALRDEGGGPIKRQRPA